MIYDVKSLVATLEKALKNSDGLDKYHKYGEGYTNLREVIETIIKEQHAAPPPSTPAGGVREALERLENACDGLAATRSQATYLAIIDNDKASDALLELDEARQQARAILSSPATPEPALAGGRDRIATVIQNAIAEHCSIEDEEIVGTGRASYRAADRILAALTPAPPGE